MTINELSTYLPFWEEMEKRLSKSIECKDLAEVQSILNRAYMKALEVGFEEGMGFQINKTTKNDLIMEFKEYQEQALSTAVYNRRWSIIYPALKLSGEAGEVSEKVGKVLRDEQGIFLDEKRLELAKELGDVLWYINALAHDIGYDLETVAKMNIEKLASRKERGMIHGSGDNR